MKANNWQMPNLSKDLALIGAGLLATAALVGAAIGVAVDVAVHRHRQGAQCDG